MSFFSSKSDYALGVDFGTQSIKAVELKKIKDKIYLSNYAWVNVTNVKEVPDAYDKDYTKRLSDALGEMFSQMKPNVKESTVAIPSFNGLVTVVDFPKMSEKEVADAIQFESRKYIPASLDEVNVSWEILKDKNAVNDKNSKKGDKNAANDKKEESTTMKVLLAAAPKSEVKYYDGLFDKKGITINSLELESFALVRSVIGNAKGRFVLVDFGAKTTNIVLVEDSVVHVNRSVDIGGADITNAIMKSMGISRDKALSLKEGGENYFTGAAKIGFPSLNYVSNEIKRVLGTQKSEKIESIVLCGGASKLTGLSEYLNKITGLPVTVGNPLSHIVYDENNSGNIKELGGSFAVAIGLALREFDEK